MISRRVAILDRKKINVGVTVFISIKTNQHNGEWLTRFAEIISTYDEVVEFFRMSGEVDYLLKVVVPDIEAYDEFYKKLVSNNEIEDVSSTFAMEAIKETTNMPLSYIVLEKLAKSKP